MVKIIANFAKISAIFEKCLVRALKKQGSDVFWQHGNTRVLDDYLNLRFKIIGKNTLFSRSSQDRLPNI